MGVKYVKDFSFPSSGGFHGDVQRYAKGGHVTKVPAKAKASAKDMPARAKPNAPAKGAPKMESKPAKGKRQGYNEGGRVPGYEMDRLPTKRPPGRGKDLAPARPFKGKYEGYAEGGPVAEILPGDGRGALEAVAQPKRTFVMPGPGYGPDPGGSEMMPVGALTPPPEEPVYATPAPYTGPMIAEEDPNFYRRALADLQADLQQRPIMEEPRYLVPEFPALRPDRSDERREMVGARGARRVAREPMARRMAARAATPRMGIPKPVPPIEMLEELPRDIRYYKKGGEVKGKSKIGKVMGEYKAGKLHSGSKKGPKVTSEKQAMAIALSEARKAGAKIPKKAEGGIFNDEDMAYQSKGPKTRYSAARSRRESKERAMERRALDKARHAEKYAPGMSLDMADRKAHGGMMKGKKFPDLTGDGKVTRADVLKGRGAFKNGGMPTHRRKPMYGGGKC